MGLFQRTPDPSPLSHTTDRLILQHSPNPRHTSVRNTSKAQIPLEKEKEEAPPLPRMAERKEFFHHGSPTLDGLAVVDEEVGNQPTPGLPLSV